MVFMACLVQLNYSHYLNVLVFKLDALHVQAVFQAVRTNEHHLNIYWQFHCPKEGAAALCSWYFDNEWLFCVARVKALKYNPTLELYVFVILPWLYSR